MDIKKLNEQLEKFLEREESPEFQNFMQSHRDFETNRMKSDRQSAVDSAIRYNKIAQKDNASDWYEKEAQEYRDKAIAMDKQINSKRRNIDKIYKELGDRGIDVNNMKVETLSLEGLNSSGLNKILKDKTQDSNKKYYLIIPIQHGDFMIYAIGSSDGKLWSSSLYKNQNIKSMETGSDTIKPFMKELNSSKNGKVYDSEVIFLVSADKTDELRRERQAARSGSLNRRAGYKGKNITPDDYRGNSSYDRKYGYTDRSGYYVDMQDLAKRLDTFKREKGSFEKPIQDSIERLDSLLTKTKEYFNDISSENIGDTISFKDFNNIINRLKSASRYIARAKEQGTVEDIKDIKYYLDAAAELLDKQ